MIVVLCRTANSGDATEWTCGRRERIIFELALPRSAWSIAVVECAAQAPGRHAEEVQFARRIFEAFAAQETSPQAFLKRRLALRAFPAPQPADDSGARLQPL